MVFFVGFLKKGLAIRVVNGDVDVFLGDIIYLTKEEWEEEEDVWANGVISEGEDDWEKGGDVVSRSESIFQFRSQFRTVISGCSDCRSLAKENLSECPSTIKLALLRLV